MTSPAVLANNVQIILGTTDVSGDLNQVRLNYNQSEIDTSVFGVTGWKEFIPSISDATIDYTGFFNKTTGQSDALIAAMFGAPAASTAFSLRMPAGGTGSSANAVYSGNCWARTKVVDAKVNDAIKMTASFRVTGAVTRAAAVP